MTTSRNTFFVLRDRQEIPATWGTQIAVEALEAKVEAWMRAATQDADTVEVPMSNEPFEVRKPVIAKYERLGWTVEDNTQPVRHLRFS